MKYLKVIPIAVLWFGPSDVRLYLTEILCVFMFLADFHSSVLFGKIEFGPVFCPEIRIENGIATIRSLRAKEEEDDDPNAVKNCADAISVQ